MIFVLVTVEVVNTLSVSKAYSYICASVEIHRRICYLYVLTIRFFFDQQVSVALSADALNVSAYLHECQL